MIANWLKVDGFVRLNLPAKLGTKAGAFLKKRVDSKCTGRQGKWNKSGQTQSTTVIMAIVN